MIAYVLRNVFKLVLTLFGFNFKKHVTEKNQSSDINWKNSKPGTSTSSKMVKRNSNRKKVIVQLS